MTEVQKIKPITRKQWIEALKSGEYEQAVNTLYSRSRGAFCCLGVACAVADKDFVYKQWDQTLATQYIDTFVGEAVARGLHLECWRDIETAGDYSPNAILSKLNDSGKTFEQIADLLIFDTWARGYD